MSSRWYYQMLMEEFGPVTVQQLRELLDEGTLSESDLVRSETSDVWISIAAAGPSLFPNSGKSPEPRSEEIGDLSELSFEFEDSGPTAHRGAYAEELTAESSRVGMSADSKPELQGHDALPSTSAHVPVPQTPANEEHTDAWFCESLGQILGPMTLDGLIELAESGVLDANDRVRCGERGLWKTVDCLPRLMRAVSSARVDETNPALTTSEITPPPPAEAMAATIQPQPPLQKQIQNPPSLVKNATTAEPQQPESVPTKSKSAKPGPKRRKNANGEDKLLDEIFDDVFSEASPPARSITTAQSISQSSPTASAASSTPSNLSPANSMASAASYSAPSPPVPSNAAGASLAAAAMAARAASAGSTRSRSSFEINPTVIGILVAVMLVAAGGYYVWNNGISFSSNNGTGTFDKAGAVKVLQAAMARYKAVGKNPSETEWKEFSDKTAAEMKALFNSVYQRAGSTPSGASCLTATKCLMKIAAANPDNKELIDKNLAEFETHIVLVTKE